MAKLREHALANGYRGVADACAKNELYPPTVYRLAKAGVSDRTAESTVRKLRELGWLGFFPRAKAS